MWLRDKLRDWLCINSDLEAIVEADASLEKRVSITETQIAEQHKLIEQHRIGASGLERQISDLRRIMAIRPTSQEPTRVNQAQLRQILDESYMNGTGAQEATSG